MQANINLIKQFILDKVGTTLTRSEAQELGIQQEYNNLAEELDVNNIDFDDVIDNKDLYAQFATLYNEETEKEATAKDKEQEKEEQLQVKDKNNAGV